MSINERLVAWLRRLAQTDRTVLDLLLAAVLIGLIGAVVFGMPSHGEPMPWHSTSAPAATCSTCCVVVSSAPSRAARQSS